MNRLVCYHYPCNDGFASAYAAHLKFGDEADYQPMGYGGLPKVKDWTLYDEVYFLDIAPEPISLVHDLIKEVGKVIILDHHKSTMEAFEADQFPSDVEAHFDMNKSGAILSWEYFVPNFAIPWMFNYIQDHDLWRHQLPGSMEVNAAIRSFPLDFDFWQNFMWNNVDDIRMVGSHVLRTERHYGQMDAKQVQYIRLADMNIPVVNSTVNGGDTAHFLLTNLNVTVAGYYFDRGDGKRQWGLRGDGTVDVSELAKVMGGGGHKGAAGFTSNQDGWSLDEQVHIPFVRKGV